MAAAAPRYDVTLFESGLQTRIAVWPMLAAVFVPLAVLGANGALLSAVAAAGQMAAAALCILIMRPSPVRAGAIWPLIGALVSMLVPALATPAAERWSSYAQVAGEAIKLLGFAACFAAGLSIAGSRRATDSLVQGMIVGALLLFLTALFLRASDPTMLWGYVRSSGVRFSGTFMNANAFGCTAAALTLPAMARIAARWPWPPLRRWGGGVGGRMTIDIGVVIVGLGCCIATRSRLALGLVLLAAAVIALATLRRRLRGFRWPHGRVAAAATAVAVALVAIVAISPAGDRIASLDTDLTVRLDAYHHYVALARAAPSTGYGLGAFVALHTATLPGPLALSSWNFGAAHNILLQAALEGGMVMLAGVTLIAGVTTTAIARKLVADRDDVILWGLAGTLAIIVVCALGDVALDVPAVAALASLVAGAAYGRSLSATGRRRR